MPTVLVDLASVLEQTGLAAWVNSSRYTLGLLSGAHLIGFALVVGSALVSARYLPGASDAAAGAMAKTGLRVIGVGLCVSVLSGALMVTPRATSALENWIFVLKMSLLAAAVVVHGFVLVRNPVAGPGSRLRRPTIVLAALLWVAVGVAGCAFILLE